MTEIEVVQTEPAHLGPLAAVADATGLFPGTLLPGMAEAFLSGAPGNLWLTVLRNGVPVGFCLARAEELADRVWNMLALAVRPDCQGQGLGSRLVSALEERLAAEGQRILLADTSGTPAFAATRGFYRGMGYDEEARIRDYWAEGDDRVTFRKRLSSAPG